MDDDIKITPTMKESLEKIKKHFAPNEEFTWLDCMGFLRRARYNLDRLYRARMLKRAPVFENSITDWVYWYDD